MWLRDSRGAARPEEPGFRGRSTARTAPRRVAQCPTSMILHQQHRLTGFDPLLESDSSNRIAGMDDRSGEVTRILRTGESGLDASLLPLVYEELRTIARQRMSRERANHTLQATALVHEAYARLLGDQDMDWHDRGHFYGAAAEAMRRVLIDHARRVGSQKRGGDRHRVTLGAPESPVELEVEQVLALDDALDRLAAEDARAAEVTRLRFLAGLTVEETARSLEISERSVAREWAFAKARLTELLADA